MDVDSQVRRVVIRLLGRGHAIAAELQKVAETLPPALRGEGPTAKRLAPVLPDFTVFRSQGAVERVASSPDLIELDEESRELHEGSVEQLFRVLAAIRKYAADLAKILDDIDGGSYVGDSVESMLRDPDSGQLLPEAIAMLGTLLLILDERIPGPCRERSLVLFYRCTVGTSRASDDYADVCKLFKGTGRPMDSHIAARPSGYPESYFARFSLCLDAVRLAIGHLQTGDIYGAASHYPLPEHRSHGLSAQAGLLYVALFFQPETLKSDGVAMREIVDRHFGDSWVVAYALGYTADLLAMWAPYPAATQALSNAITASTVRQLQDQHLQRLAKTRENMTQYLTEGVLTEEFVPGKTSALLSCLRQANTSIRWLLLQPTTWDLKLNAICLSSAQIKEQLLGALVDTALLEDKIKSLLVPLVARRDTDWQKLKTEASQAMDDLAVYFSGDHALRRNVRNEELENWFRGLQQRIDELSFASQEDVLVLGRKVSQLATALEEVSHYHEVSQQPQILHFLSDARKLLQQMLRTANLSEDVLRTIETVADLSYAWKALGAYRETMGGLLSASPNSVKGLRALFLKLASVLETPLRRIRQSGNKAQETLVSDYYSDRLVQFMRSVLQEIPRLIFKLIGRLSEQEAARLPTTWTSRITVAEFQGYAEKSSQAYDEVSTITKHIALLMRGIRETDVAVLGVISVEPRTVLLDGLRQELACQIEYLLAGLHFGSCNDAARALEGMAVKSRALCQSFEHLQDYLGVSALQLWHQEFGRVVRFLLHMELHSLLRRRLPPLDSVPYHDSLAPISFPDASSSSAGDSFISRTVAMLIESTDPKTVTGGLHHEWCSSQSSNSLIDGLFLNSLMTALRPPGIAAVSKILSLRAADRLQKTISACRSALDDQEVRSVITKIKMAIGDDCGRISKVVKPMQNSLLQQFGPLLQGIVGIGQIMLLQRRLASLLQVQCSLNASLAGDALSVLDHAALAETQEVESDSLQTDDDGLPSLWDFAKDSDKGLSPDESQLRVYRKLARAGELPGFANPIRQMMQVIPEGTAPADIDILLMLAMFAHIASRPTHTGLAKSPKRTNLTGQTVSSPRKASTTFSNMYPAFAAGCAAVLQQLPRKTTNGLLSLCGSYLQSLSANATEGHGSFATEAVILIDCLSTLISLLGLSQANVADYIPQGLLDLLPVER